MYSNGPYNNMYHEAILLYVFPVSNRDDICPFMNIITKIKYKYLIKYARFKRQVGTI